MKLSVIIVNYNVKGFLLQTLHSLKKALKHISSYEIIVVDNASDDGSESHIKRLFPEVNYLYNTHNVGFACANNQAIALSKAEYLLLLNPDTLLPEDNIDNLLNFMQNQPEAGACGVMMRSANGAFLPESKRGYPSPLASFWRLSGIYKLFPHHPRFDGYYLSRLCKDEVHHIPILAGAYMMVRREAMNQCIGFDESFFMYGEDIDLSYRIEQCGYKNYYVPEPILHYKGESTRKLSYKYVVIFYDAMTTFFKKHGSDYSLATQIMVHAGIKFQCGLKLMSVAVKRMKKQLLPATQKEKKFLIVAKEEHIEALRKLLKRNGLVSSHHFVVGNEHTVQRGHEIKLSGKENFTHIVYDTSAFSYKTMLHHLPEYEARGVELGVYHPEYHMLVLSGACYN